jgi:hypothetical protein
MYGGFAPQLANSQIVLKTFTGIPHPASASHVQAIEGDLPVKLSAGQAESTGALLLCANTQRKPDSEWKQTCTDFIRQP